MTHCCEHEKKLEEFKLESSRALQLALRTKTDEIRLLNMENKRLLETEKRLLNEINIMKRQMQKYMHIRNEESSDSEQENNNNNTNTNNNNFNNSQFYYNKHPNGHYRHKKVS